MSTEARSQTDPGTAKEIITDVLKDDPELLQDALESRKGYCETVLERVREEYGEEYVPGSGAAYVSNVRSMNRDELEQHMEDVTDEEDEEETEEDPYDKIEIGELDTTEDYPSDKARCKAVLKSSGDLLQRAADGDIPHEEVKEIIRGNWNALYVPTEDTVRSAVADLRNAGDLPSTGCGAANLDEDEIIVYSCELCGEFEHSDIDRMRLHISELDDPVHHGYNARDPEAISVFGEERDFEESVFSDPDFREQAGKNFEIIRELRYNLGARQRDIAEKLGMQQANLSQRISDMGIEWDNREEDVENLLTSWEKNDVVLENGSVQFKGPENNNMVLEDGTVRYKGPEKGLDTTSGNATQTITERPETGTVSITLTQTEAEQFLTGEDQSTVREKILERLLE